MSPPPSCPNWLGPIRSHQGWKWERLKSLLRLKFGHSRSLQAKNSENKIGQILNLKWNSQTLFEPDYALLQILEITAKDVSTSLNMYQNIPSNLIPHQIYIDIFSLQIKAWKFHSKRSKVFCGVLKHAKNCFGRFDDTKNDLFQSNSPQKVKIEILTFQLNLYFFSINNIKKKLFLFSLLAVPIIQLKKPCIYLAYTLSCK